MLMILLVLFIFVSVVACSDEVKEEENTLNTGTTTFEIYSVNDFHGILLESSTDVGISKIGQYLKLSKENAPETTIILSAGDMFQGSALSSMTRGEAVVDCMNVIGFDAMTIGNHEFDWGIETVLKYNDNDLSNGELNCRLLCANVLDKTTNSLASWANPYVVLEKLGYRIGVLGIIGSDQESDILKDYVVNYDFTDEFEAITKYVPILRNEEKCDLVILSIHNDTSNINTLISRLKDDSRVDAILNGHTHQAYFGEYTFGRSGAPLPYVQSGCYGSYIGYITLTVDNATREVIDVSSENISAKDNCLISSKEIDDCLQKYSEYIELSKSVIGKAATTIYKDDGGVWACNVIKNCFNSQIGVCNMGGIRTNAFPMYANENVTYNDLFEMLPFENVVCTVSMKGKDVKELLSRTGLYFSSNVNAGNNTIDGKAIDDNYYYNVATIDYIFVQDYYPFKKGINAVKTDKLFRDVIVEEARRIVSEKGKLEIK